MATVHAIVKQSEIEPHEMLHPSVAYIQKPFMAGDLERKVRAALDESRDAPRGLALAR